MSRGFTFLEVVVALLLLEIAVLAAAGTLLVASRSLAEAELVEMAVVEAEGVLDSLAGVNGAVSGTRAFPRGQVEWTVDAQNVIVLRAISPDSTVLVDVTSALTPR